MVQDQILLTDCFSFLTVPRPYHQLESLLLLHLIIFFIFVSFCASSLTLTATKYVLKQCFMFSISDLTKWDRKSDQTVVGELHTSIFPAVAILNPRIYSKHHSPGLPRNHIFILERNGKHF